jgi:hypothetical protein
MFSMSVSKLGTPQQSQWWKAGQQPVHIVGSTLEGSCLEKYTDKIYYLFKNHMYFSTLR